jgi:dipeptidyl aminopeptidase/acylaminoacyl peptidase
VQTVAGVTPSPDGSGVVYTQTQHVIEEERSEQVSQIFLAKADGSARRQLTFGDRSSTAPSFSPDGRLVYFRSARTGNSNIWRIPIDGGEAQPVTNWKGDIGEYAVSPDGKWLAFTGAQERPDEARNSKQKRDFWVVGENPKNHRIWLVPTTSRPSAFATPKPLSEADRHVAALDWAPDSGLIVFEHRPSPSPDHWTKADLSEVDIETGAVTGLVTTAASESQPRCSPDGRFVAFVQTPERARWPGDARVAVLTRKEKTVRQLSASWDERPNLLGWNPASSQLYFAEMKHTRAALYALSLEGPPKLIYEPRKGTFFAGYGPNAHLNRKGDFWGFAQESSDEAPEAFVAKLPGGVPVVVSRANLDLPKPPLGETKAIRWKAKDGQEIEGLLTYPVGYRLEQKYPLILNIHGGPSNYFSETFLGKAGIYPLAMFAERGYAILRPNPRGSGGYGKAFRFANVNDWGGKDYEDIMAGVDHVISLGVADADRMAVMGWSYGGFMTSWVITHTGRFRAAVVGAAVTNLWSFTGTSDIPGFLPDYFQGEPWEVFENYRKHSPMSYVKGVNTPTLILHGAADDRVPISQGYEFYNALKRQGTNVQMVVYPRTPHSPQEPKFIQDLLQRHLDWVEKYVPAGKVSPANRSQYGAILSRARQRSSAFFQHPAGPAVERFLSPPR